MKKILDTYIQFFRELYFLKVVSFGVKANLKAKMYNWCHYILWGEFLGKLLLSYSLSFSWNSRYIRYNFSLCIAKTLTSNASVNYRTFAPCVQKKLFLSFCILSFVVCEKHQKRNLWELRKKILIKNITTNLSTKNFWTLFLF